ncbi:glutathione S-transferase [Violaceomyces palustris]|uniref:Glutathione S-transferase n=1 Tax=Violaceomyces palustris TaxID=1673888 RepID=A0ACD0P6F5_9BASI|nr:glutathione S-transferase [Violaceomyces palustris]
MQSSPSCLSSTFLRVVNNQRRLKRLSNRIPFSIQPFSISAAVVAAATTFNNPPLKMQPIKLYTANTPNGEKVSILCEELKALGKLDYEVHAIDIMKNIQKEDWFLKINPNGRIPAIVDPNNNDFSVMESAAILLYLEKKFDDDHAFSWPSTDAKGDDYRSEVLQWIFFAHGGTGPMQGQANHFRMQAVGESKNVIPYAIKRYRDETLRLYSVYEKHLEGRDWLVGEGKGKYSIADMNAFPWVLWHKFAGIKDEEVGPNVTRWLRNNLDRPAVQKGLRIPSETELLKKILNEVSPAALPTHSHTARALLLFMFLSHTLDFSLFSFLLLPPSLPPLPPQLGKKFSMVESARLDAGAPETVMDPQRTSHFLPTLCI